MKKHLMMLGAMYACTGLVASAASDTVVIDDGSHDGTTKKTKPQAKAIASPRQERKEKSSSLKRMLGRKGRA